ncbi:AP-3 complex subunit beta [Balamuthia mandrillaris]
MQKMKMNKLGLGNAHYFEASNPKFEEIKQLLEHDNLKEKLEGMKRLVALMSKGKDVSLLYPSVVKNVFCKNMQIKKLVYMYLVHYAELEPDPALLAINNFQRDMASDNPLMRALGLRVLSSIRLKVIVQVVVLSCKKAAKDTSAYVRKAAAQALPKVYSLEPEMLPDLIDILQLLLKDTSTMVIGSAMAAFNHLCPTRFDMLHPHFRKICHMLADVDEWGQTAILDALTKYGRTQFLDPNLRDSYQKQKKKKKQAKKGSDEEDEESSSSDSSSDEGENPYDDAMYDMDPDHRLLLNAAAMLLRSRNAAVVMSVASLLYYLAPNEEAVKVGRPLTRMLRGTRELQYAILSNIASMAVTRPAMFQPFLLEFFVASTDPIFIRNLKLEILTCIANESNIHNILEELNTYVYQEDKELVTAAIQAIGRCASRIKDVAETCMRTLMQLISNSSEAVVAESVVVIKKLLQMGAKSDFPLDKVVAHLARLLDDVTVPKARASTIWVIGEYRSHIPLLAPDILRKLAKNFVQEDDSVKLQILNLGSKLVLDNPSQTAVLFKYILDLAKYDLNYDVRDRGRLLRSILLGTDTPNLKEHAARLFTAEKPTPVSLAEQDAEEERYHLGSLSHLVDHMAVGYTPIPDWPEETPDTDRTPEGALPAVGGEQRLEDANTSGSSFYSHSSDDEDFWGSDSSYSSGSRSRSGSSASSYSSSRSGSDTEEGSQSFSDDESYSSYSDESSGDEKESTNTKQQKSAVSFGDSNGTLQPQQPTTTSSQKEVADAVTTTATIITEGEDQETSEED